MRNYKCITFRLEALSLSWCVCVKPVDSLMSYVASSVKIGLRHPDPVVETSSLSSVNPPDVWYRLSISEEVIDRGCLSALQLEAITYAAQVKARF